MSIIPTWPFVAGALLIGLAGGAYVDHSVMAGRIQTMKAQHADELAVRDAQRAADERTARNNERQMAEAIALAEQEKTNAIAATRATADSLLERVRQRAATKPTCPGGLPAPAPAGQGAAGGVVLDRSGEGTVRLAARAEVIRIALGACYQAYDAAAAPAR
jgi:hypothetical protein